MKSIKFIGICFFALSVIYGCKQDAKNNKSNEMTKTEEAAPQSTTDPVAIPVNTANSVINWSGNKLIGGGHTGTISLTEGRVLVDNNKVVGGKFEIDMNSITCTDLKPEEGGSDLVGHLKSPDFFDVEKNPVASYSITKVTSLTGDDSSNAIVYGMLNLNGATNNVTFKATIDVNGGNVSVKTNEFTIDRTQFGIEYGSSNIVDLAKDKIIKNEIGLSINLVTKV